MQISVTRNWYLRMHYWISLFFIDLIKTHDRLFNDARSVSLYFMLFRKLPTCIKTQTIFYFSHLFIVIDFLCDLWTKIFIQTWIYRLIFFFAKKRRRSYVFMQISFTRSWHLYMHYWISILLINLIKTQNDLFNDARFHSTLCYLGNHHLALNPRPSFIYLFIIIIDFLRDLWTKIFIQTWIFIQFWVTRSWYPYMHYWICILVINQIKPLITYLIWVTRSWYIYICTIRLVVGLCLTWEKLASDSVILNDEQRSRLYDKMERDLDENGPAFLKQGETSQSLSLSDIFTLKDGHVTPVLKVWIEQISFFFWISWYYIVNSCFNWVSKWWIASFVCMCV